MNMGVRLEAEGARPAEGTAKLRPTEAAAIATAVAAIAAATEWALRSLKTVLARVREAIQADAELRELDPLGVHDVAARNGASGTKATTTATTIATIATIAAATAAAAVAAILLSIVGIPVVPHPQRPVKEAGAGDRTVEEKAAATRLLTAAATELAATHLAVTELATTAVTVTELVATELAATELAATVLATTVLATTVLTELAATELADTDLSRRGCRQQDERSCGKGQAPASQQEETNGRTHGTSTRRGMDVPIASQSALRALPLKRAASTSGEHAGECQWIRLFTTGGFVGSEYVVLFLTQ
jgi:hypothetical protein